MLARWMVSIVALLVAAIALAECASSTLADAPKDLPTIPAKLRVDGPRIAWVHAKGVQIYVCSADASGKLSWTLKAPEATFEDENGLHGKHYAGPTWEVADGSKVVGKKDAESPAEGAIPWLLLEAKSHEGNGLLSAVTYIQRISTTGGKAPPVKDAKAGDEARIDYTADYVFYGPGATTKPAAP